MGFSEEEVKKVAELRLWIEGKIAEFEGEITRLREALKILDAILSKSSFKVAAELAPQPPPQRGPVAIVVEKVEPPEAEFKEVRPLRRTKDGFLLANAYISAKRVVIVPVSELRINVSTPPFRSFFINRILDGMKGKDLEGVSQGKIKSEEVLGYTVEEEEGIIKKIIVDNYRDKARVDEIINTATWTFTRMLEKIKPP